MSNKNYLSSIPIIFIVILILTRVLSAFGVEKKAADQIMALEQKIHQFEADLYQRQKASQENFDQAYSRLDSLIGQLIDLSQQQTKNDFLETAYAYLEKRKNLRLIELFYKVEYSDSLEIPYCRLLQRNLQLCQKFEKLRTVILLSDSLSDEAGFQKTLLRQSMAKLADSVSVIEPAAEILLKMMNPVEIPDFRKNILDRKEVLLNYWLNEDRLYAFVLSREKFALQHWAINKYQLQEQIKALMTPFYYSPDLLKLQFDDHLAHKLYRELIEPLAALIGKNFSLNISADESFIGLPFEILVVDTVQTSRIDETILYDRFHHMHFLIIDHAISYNFSTSAFHLEMNGKELRKGLGNRLLTMSEPLLPESDSLPLDQNLKNLVNHLSISRITSAEIKRVSRLLWLHHNLKAEQATKKYLLDKGKTYRWLYLALPGILNNEQPRASSVFFSKSAPDDDIWDQFLSVEEIKHCQLQADMLTLSTCQFETPFINHNIATLVLPQSFLLAGVRSLVHSQWIVNAISVSDFMAKFYWELKYKRQVNAAALREAKVKSMKDTFIFLDREISSAHPYFWAGYMLSGNPHIRPPSPSRIPPWGVVIIVYVLVSIFAFIIVRRTMPGRESEK